MSHGHAPSNAAPRLERSSLVGRDGEVSSVLSALDAGHRLVTITGAPGIGKTRVLERIGAELAVRSTKSVTWVDLADVTTADGLVQAVGQAIGTSLAAESAHTAAHAVARALKRDPAMLLLDNLEQLVDAPAAEAQVAAALALWLDQAPVAIVTTSRSRLRLSGEHAVEITALSVASGIALFEERARACGGTALDLDLPLAEQIVRKLGGNPLAIEIAAARAPLLGLAGLLERLAAGLDVLASGAREGHPRQASVTATLEWSWTLSSKIEQSALVQLSVFKGGFTMDAAEAVLAVGDAPMRSGALDVVERLRDRSLLVCDRGADGPRFSLCPLVRSFVEVRASAGERSAAADRHAAHFGAAARRIVTSQGAPPASIEAEEANFEAAFFHSSESSLVADLGRGRARGLARRGSRDAHEQILVRGIEHAARARRGDAELELLQARAALASAAGEVALAQQCQERAVTLATERRDPSALSLARARLGWDLFELGDVARGVEHIRAALDIAQRERLVEREAYARNRLGHALLSMGDASEALDELSRAVLLAHETPNRWLRGKCLAELASAQRRLGHVEAAARRLVELEAIGSDPDNDDALVHTLALRERGGLLRAQGRFEEADHVLHHAEGEADAIAAPRLGCELRVMRATLALDRGEPADALQILEDALALATRVEAKRYRAEAYVALTSARALAGDLRGAGAALDLVETVDALTVAAHARERALLLVQMGADDEIVGGAIQDALFSSKRVGGTPHALALALAVAHGGEQMTPRGDERRGAADAAFSRTSDEEARQALLAARGGRPQAFAVARRIGAHRQGQCARELLVARDGRFYEVDGRRTSLSRQRSLRLIFLALVEQAERQPGIGLSQTEVLARGWPGEKMRADSGATRVYTSIRRLRKSGLIGVLVTRDDGYLLDPTVAIRRIEASA